MGILDAPPLSKAALSATFAPRPIRLADLASPVIIPHKGAILVAPEHTAAAYRYGVANGFDVIDLDAQPLADGALANIHDTTIDNLTTGTGNVNTQTAASFPLLTMDPSTWAAPGWPNMNPELIADVMTRYAGKKVIQVEAKTSTTTDVQRLVNLATSLNIKQSVVISAGTLAALAPALAAGIECHIITNTPDAPTLIAAGVTSVVMDAGVASDTTVQAAITAGLKVYMWDITRRYDLAHYVAMGVRGVYSGDPVYVRGTTALLTADTFATGLYAPGHQLSASSRGILGGGKIQFPVAGANAWALMGFLCPIVASTYTVTGTFTFDNPGASASAIVGFHLCEPDDRPYVNNAGNAGYRAGYRVTYQQNGALQINRTDTNGTVTLLGNLGVAVPTTGQSITMTVTVTPTTISASVPAQSKTIAPVADATYRGGYLHVGQNGNAGAMISSVSGLSVG